MTLTYEALRAQAKEWARLAPPPPCTPFGIPLYIGPEPWPQEDDGFIVHRYEAHPLVKWLARYLPITPYVEVQRRKTKDSNPFMFLGGMHVSRRQHAAIVAATTLA
jgi:hypothetical protein